MVKTVPTTGSVRFKPQVNEAAPGAIFAKADLVVLHVDCSNGSFWPNPLSSDHHPELNLLAKSELGRAPYMVFSSPQSFFGHGRMGSCLSVLPAGGLVHDGFHVLFDGLSNRLEIGRFKQSEHLRRQHR